MTAITVEQLSRETERYVREARVATIAIEVNGQVVAMLKPAEQNAAISPTNDSDQLMDSLLQATSHFRVGRKPTREEMNER